MNTYRMTFSRRSPQSGDEIAYRLTVQCHDPIKPEALREEVEALPAEGFHEDLADRLAYAIPGTHTLVAMHRGVEIMTQRGKGRHYG